MHLFWECVLFLTSSKEACINRTNTCFEAKHCRLIEEILVCLWTLKVHYFFHRSLDHLNLFSTLVPYFFNIHFSTVFHLCLSISWGLFPSVVQKHLYWKSHIYPPSIGHPNIFWWRIQIVRLLIMQFSQVACYFLWQICSKYTDIFWDMSVLLQPVAPRW